MDIIEFFQHSAGKWFSQRTSQDLAAVKAIAGTTDLWIETLSLSDPEAIALCQQYAVDPTEALCSARIRWESKPTGSEPKQSGSTLLVALGDGAGSQEGQLLRKPANSETLPSVTRYAIGTDDVLTLIAESEQRYTEDRIWFASDNLRLRTSIVKQPDGFSIASFYSEIRMGGGKG